MKGQCMPPLGRRGSGGAPPGARASRLSRRHRDPPGQERHTNPGRRTTMYIYQGKRVTREEKRRQQRLRANLIGLALIAALVAAGLILGLTAGVSL